MPLYLDLGGLRVVLACWSAGAMRIVGGWVTPGAPMMMEFLVLANQRGADGYKAIEVLLKGPELSLAEKGQCGFMDKDGNIRSDARIRWWDVSARTLDRVAEIPPGSQTQVGDPYPERPAVECLDGAAFEYRDETPVIYGHYWRSWAPNGVGTGRRILPVSISAPSRVDHWSPTGGKERRRSHVRGS